MGNNGKLCIQMLVVGGHRSALYSSASHFIRGHNIPNDRVSLVSFQGILVLVCIILYVSVFRIPWNAHSFSEPEFSSSFHIGYGGVHDIESFCRLPFAKTGKPFLYSFFFQLY